MKVFPVIKNIDDMDYDCILGVFDTIEKAIEYAKNNIYDCIIMSCEINNPDNQKYIKL